jgi:hypothetical protein
LNTWVVPIVTITNPITTPASGAKAKISPEMLPADKLLKPLTRSTTENGIEKTNNNTPITSRGIPSFTPYLLAIKVVV